MSNRKGIIPIGYMTTTDGRTLPGYRLDSFLDTTEGWNLAAQHGMRSDEYLTAREEWEQDKVQGNMTEEEATDLVVIKGDELFTDSLIIAEGTQNQHGSVKKLIATYQNEFEVLGRVWISNRTLQTKGGPQTITYYELSESQATFLMTLLKNSPIVVAFKLELVQQFTRMRRILQGRTAPSLPPPQEQLLLVTRMERLLDRMEQQPTVPALVPMMRTRDQVLSLLKQADPDTRMTYSSLNRLIRERRIAYVTIGRKTLINYGTLLEYLASPDGGGTDG